MPRTIVAPNKYQSEELLPGVLLERFHPGGKNGPNEEVLSDYPGGQVWTEMFVLGDAADAFQLAVPDIRMPANQYWPLHWHDCWVGIVVLEGSCMVGDWWMRPGDVLITPASVEYGPLLIGPKGCRMFEIFAKLHLQIGGYGPEYHDHPTLQGGLGSFSFTERASVNKRNEGRQTLPLNGAEGFVKGHLSHGAQWDLGSGDDPDRGILKVTRLAAGENVAARKYDDWYAILVIDGSLRVAGQTFGTDHYLLARPGSQLNFEAGDAGALLLEVSRTARVMNAQMAGT